MGVQSQLLKFLQKGFFFGFTLSEYQHSCLDMICLAVFPKLTMMPKNVSVEAGKTFQLHCQADGHPEPVLSWQKDGGTNFPAANDRRMDFVPASKVYVIRNAQPVDTGRYTCTASNEAGSVNATAFVTVLGK